MHNLRNKVAVVTGASKGIGAGIAKRLASLGVKVMVNYSSSKDASDEARWITGALIDAAGGWR
jgi:3-oxoacyl-[acyl-carrier protein] reductase